MVVSVADLVSGISDSCFSVIAGNISSSGSGSVGRGVVTLAVSLGVGVFSTFSVCGHTAAHRARQAVIAVAMMILFFILFPPLWI